MFSTVYIDQYGNEWSLSFFFFPWFCCWELGKWKKYISCSTKDIFIHLLCGSNRERTFLYYRKTVCLIFAKTNAVSFNRSPFIIRCLGAVLCDDVWRFFFRKGSFILDLYWMVWFLFSLQNLLLNLVTTY